MALLFAAAFLLGAVPFSWLFARFAKGVDLRRFGSGNPGATNASRAFPPRWRVPVFLALFLLDAGKGFLAAGVLPALFTSHEAAPALAGAAAVLGHTFTPFLGFRGGKGVATTCGALLALEPTATLLALGVFCVTLAITRVVAAGSLAFAVALPVAVFVRGEAPLAVGLLAIALAVLIVLRHRRNIRTMLGGAAA